ncbi:hypothetical protein K461DRAFT_256015 [Myriangium duriaei CBS 260.36]|uniref:Xylanolytic transcriptional activator regulatory domain-containing protein n=1 Tax=Myriangium duriaei CBS 260.36 TaxID=1168546 RepID=A0A9P4MJM5_9PEZI|nr:hypothetical protein K461DRAFT_256015 [Myriangium duriaei CBS 260.36]
MPLQHDSACPPSSGGDPAESSPRMRQSHSVTAATDASSAAAAVPTQRGERPSTPPPLARFIGHLNPEGIFRICSTDEAALSGEVGVWQNGRSTERGAVRAATSEVPSTSLLYCTSSLAYKVLLPVMEDQCLKTLPSEPARGILEGFYFSSIHPLLPIIDKDHYRGEAGSSSTQILRSQAVCLLASLDPSMQQHLFLPEVTGLASPKEFGQRLFAAMRMSIEITLVRDKMAVIEVLLAMSLFSSNGESMELSSWAFLRAVNMSYTLGLHHRKAEREHDRRLAEIFCCAWCLDRIHAAIHGRPVIMHECDLARLPEDCLVLLQPAFRVLLSIAMLLDRVIELYRPRAKAMDLSDQEFPSFEDMLVSCDASGLPQQFLNTLEMFYNATGILSCRSSSRDQGMPILSQNPRHKSCANTISEIVRNEADRNLIMLPFVPYAVALTLSASYRELRLSKISTVQDRALRSLHQNYHWLRQLECTYHSAAVIAELVGGVLASAKLNTSKSIHHHGIIGPAVAGAGHTPAPGNSVDEACHVHMSRNYDYTQTQGYAGAPPSAFTPGLDFPDNTVYEVLGAEWLQNDVDEFFEAYLNPAIPVFLE